ncbi:Nuclear pore complex protein Nup98-Nup96 [Papilio machaon]|uniref:Nuclear pore complex protein Nup98-Nup96 n=1 Tax=Papilio machaon TaxID=76193 RepID=A0A0N1IK02_PAPMA|nr:Nuclear pore complex protein Nup98-Nup96 [Papilio machaon]
MDGCDQTFRSLIAKQLQLWRECGATQVIAHYRHAILELLAGIRPRGELEKLDWIRALHVTAKYLCPQVPHLEQVIRTYEGYFISSDDEVDLGSVEVDEMGMAVPQPPFLLGSWLGHPTTDSIKGVAEQLETRGYWQLAIQALAYLQNTTMRGHLIRGVLSRNAAIRRGDEEPELGLLEKMRIPKEWILLAQADRAKYEHQPKLEVEYLVGARQWNAAHRVLVEQILADCVLSGMADRRPRALRWAGGWCSWRWLADSRRGTSPRCCVRYTCHPTALYRCSISLPNSTTVYQILPQSTKFYHSLPNSTTVYQILPQSTKFYHSLPNSTTVYQILPQSTKFYHSLPNSTTVYQILPQSTKFYHSLPNSTTVYQILPQSTKFYHSLPNSTTIYQFPPQSTKFYHNLPNSTIIY